MSVENSAFTRIFALALMSLASFVFAVEAPLPRHPAPSPDGSQIAFSWQGDLWIVAAVGGEARRLTAHPAAERHPIWSRDGSRIAFSSNRYGNFDVFVLPIDGSEAPRRLTFASVDDTPTDFTADGSAVLFFSSRARSIRWMAELYTVPIAGGTPQLAQSALGDNGAYSPDGGQLAFVRGATKWTRRGYRGSANRDLWLNTGGDDFVQLTTFAGDDSYPHWINPHTLTFLSARSGRKNVFFLDLVSGGARQLTYHDDSDVRFPHPSANGKLVAYEFEDRIWTIKTDGADGAEPSQLHIEVPADQVVNTMQRRTMNSDAEELVINPDGNLAAFVVHGDIFVTDLMSKEDQEIAQPRTVQVTQTPNREKDISWSPDGSSLLFASARNGSFDLYLTRPANPETEWTDCFDFAVEQLTSSDSEEHLALFSPDGERIAFVRGKGDLAVINKDGTNETLLLQHWDPPTFDWSPDGKWLVYSTNDVHYNSEIFIIPAGGGEAYNLSRHPDDDVNPQWSEDGKRIVWNSKRHADTLDVWGVWLTRADDERTPTEWLKLWKDDKEKKKNSDKDETAADDREEKKPEIPEVTIDFDGLWERSASITALKGDEGPAIISPDGKRIVFSADHEGDRDLYSVRWDGDDIKRLTTDGQVPAEVQFSDSGKMIFYLNDKGLIKRVDLDGKAGDPAPFTAHFEMDILVERAAVFDEAWRALNEWFYDPGFHGVNWQAQHKKYRPWALAASQEVDFADIMNLMIGELNASHMRYSGLESDDPGSEETGWIGAVYNPAAGGPGILIDEVLRDTPADRRDVSLASGDRILRVNGRSVEPTSNIHALFAGTVNQRVALVIQAADQTMQQRVVVPDTFKSQRQARYETWVRQRRALVDTLSEGRLGYLHIQGMSSPSFEEFERDLYAAGKDKEGLIIDVRSNGGGWTTDYLMAVLSVKRHAYTVPRDSTTDERAYPQSRLPLAAWTQPALTLCNEDSYSNAEIFSWAFQGLGRGLLVGTPTYGAVISTDGTRLLNGGWLRLPLRGWYVAGSGANMENNGAQPDILVWPPAEDDLSATHDAQLAKAVDVFLEGIKKDPRYGAW